MISKRVKIFDTEFENSCLARGYRKGNEYIGHVINAVGGSPSVMVDSPFAPSAERVNVLALIKMAVEGEVSPLAT